MKCLSIKQPWAWLILCAGKDRENRSWNTNFRGRILIHSGKYEDVEAMRRLSDEQKDYFRGDQPGTKRGGLVGSVEIIDVHWPEQVADGRPVSRWQEYGKYGFVLQNPKVITFIPYQGALNLFDVPDEILV